MYIYYCTVSFNALEKVIHIYCRIIFLKKKATIL